MRRLIGSGLAVALAVSAAWRLPSNSALACPVCNGVATTLSDEVGSAEIVVFATLSKLPPPPSEDGSGRGDALEATFRISRVLKGAESLAERGDPQEFSAIFFGQHPPGTEFLVYGRIDVFEPEKEGDEDEQVLVWTTPTALTKRASEYIIDLAALKPDAADRLAFFMNAFEDADRLVAADSYDEFAKATYNEIVRLKEIMPREKLIAWATDAQVPATHRRLYLILLGVCGKEDDALIVESLIENEDRAFRITLDAAASCYLNLTGAEGLPLIEKLFLSNEEAHNADVYAAIGALRFQQEYGNGISRERLLESLRLLLDRPKFADLIIPDLARAQDWSVIDKLAQLFKDASKTSYVRIPIFNYLRQCPLPRAKEVIEELAAIDPKAYKQAVTFYPQRTAKPEGEPSPSAETASGEQEDQSETDAKDAAGSASG